MLLYLFLLFTIVPLVELALLIWLGTETMWWIPIALVLFTGIAGAALARRQGWQTGSRIQNELRSGRLPADAMLDGFLIVVAAILLIAPGVLTDFVGLALLLPPVRRVVKRAAINGLRRHVEMKTAQFSAIRPDDLDRHAGPRGHDEIIEARVIKSRVEEVE